MKTQMTANFECGMYVLDEARRRATEGGFNAHFGFKQSRNARVGEVSFTQHQAIQSTTFDSLVYEATSALNALDETAASKPGIHASTWSA